MCFYVSLSVHKLGKVIQRLYRQGKMFKISSFFVGISFFIFSACVVSDTAYVRIFISDVNDNKPAFAQASYEVDVDEDADVGFAILTVSANDGDEGGSHEKKCRYLRSSNYTNSTCPHVCALLCHFHLQQIKSAQAVSCKLKSAAIRGCVVLYFCESGFSFV